MRIIIASHGKMAEGMKNSAEIIIGKNDKIDTICAYIDETIDYQKLIKETIESHDYHHRKLIVLTDLLGGSVNTEFLKYINDFEFYLISGVNLPLLIELAVRDSIKQEDLISILDNCQNNIRLFSKLSISEYEEDDDFI